MKLFAQISKVDEEKRLVFGRAAEEAVDKADEIMDYASSKPLFQKWSSDIAKDTGGKNLGNVRAMHGKVAAGMLTGIDFNDVAKAIDVQAHIADDNEWKKVLKGVYTGFSIGGSYVGESKVEKMDGRDVKRYTANPSEISLVDRPCMPGAKFFEVQKADGSLQKVDFAATEQEEVDVQVDGSAEDIVELGKLMAEEKLDVQGLIAKAFPNKSKAAKKPDPGSKDAVTADATDAATNPSDPTGADADADDPAPWEKVDALTNELAALRKVEKPTPEQTAKIASVKADLAKALTAEPKKSPEELAKIAKAQADEALAKMVTDAVTKATEPLSKALDAAKAEITLLKAQPAAPTVRLRAVSKSGDVDQNVTGKEKGDLSKAEPLVDGHGDKHEAAGIIKALHQSHGAPLHQRNVR